MVSTFLQIFLCYYSISIVTNPIKVVIQPHLYPLSVVSAIVPERKKGPDRLLIYWVIYQNPLF